MTSFPITIAISHSGNTASCVPDYCSLPLGPSCFHLFFSCFRLMRPHCGSLERCLHVSHFTLCGQVPLATPPPNRLAQLPLFGADIGLFLAAGENQTTVCSPSQLPSAQQRPHWLPCMWGSRPALLRLLLLHPPVPASGALPLRARSCSWHPLCLASPSWLLLHSSS